MGVAHCAVCMWSRTARTQLVRWSGRRSEWCHTLPEAVRRPIRQRVRDPPQVGSPCSPLRTLSRLHAGGVDLGCDPASWFSVADASMGKDGRPDLHNVPTHPRCTCPWGGVGAPAGGAPGGGGGRRSRMRTRGSARRASRARCSHVRGTGVGGAGSSGGGGGGGGGSGACGRGRRMLGTTPHRHCRRPSAGRRGVGRVTGGGGGPLASVVSHASHSPWLSAAKGLGVAKGEQQGAFWAANKRFACILSSLTSERSY